MNTPRFTTPQYIAHLKLLRSKASLHCLATASLIVPALDSMISNLESDGHDAKALAYSERVMAARRGDPIALAEVTSIRETRINNYLIARSNWLMFFDMVTLQPAEEPYWTNESRQEAAVNVSVGADGGFRRSRILKYKERTQINLFQIASELYEYFLWDPLRGNVADEIKALIDIAGDLEEKINQKAKPYVAASCVSTFTQTGARSGRTFTLHSSIDVGNIPTGNRLAPAASTRFSKGCMDAILGYCASFGMIFGEMLRPDVVLLPSSDATGQLADVTLTSQQNDITSQIYGGGQILDYGGQKWNILPDVTLSPADGYAYVRLGRAIGQYFTKPSGDKSYDNPAKDGPLGNTGEMGMSKWIGFCTPLPWNPFVLRVKYK